MAAPDWVRRAVFYQVFPDRFARGERFKPDGVFESWDSPPTELGFKGGDLYGVSERLDHLGDLGVNALYLNPIFQSPANHRYHASDYLQVDPVLGGDEALRALLDAAHARGMRVVLDGVFNHCGRGFFPFVHLLENGDASPYRDWFHVRGWPLKAYEGTPNYACWYNLGALPKFNTANPEVRRYLLRVARHWLAFGVDGWRLDVPNEIDDDAFWREFRTVCKGVNPEAYLVGEIWGEAKRWLQGDMFDAVMNYLLPAACLRYFAGEKLRVTHEYGGRPMAPIDAAAFRSEVRAMLGHYPAAVNLAQMNILTTHDTDRMRTAYGGDERRMRLALVFSFFVPGAPSVYYGEEVGLDGTLAHGARAAMPWDDSRWDRELLGLYRRLIRLRRTRPVFASGDFELLETFGDLLAYERRLPGERFAVLVNRSDAPVRAPYSAEDLRGAAETVSSKSHPLGSGLELEPWGYSVLELRP
ncbi:MAG: glycoside hydrolase family 13 protein [Elusimicrobiota bacterium]|jgi:neopullulanase